MALLCREALFRPFSVRHRPKLRATSGVINAGSFGQFVFAPILQKLIQVVGWMGAMWAMAVMTLVALPLVGRLTQPVEGEVNLCGLRPRLPVCRWPSWFRCGATSASPKAFFPALALVLAIRHWRDIKNIYPRKYGTSLWISSE